MQAACHVKPRHRDETGWAELLVDPRLRSLSMVSQGIPKTLYKPYPTPFYRCLHLPAVARDGGRG